MKNRLSVEKMTKSFSSSNVRIRDSDPLTEGNISPYEYETSEIQLKVH